MENIEDFENIISLNWPHLFSTIDPNTSITITKLSTRNWLISSVDGLSYILKSASSSSTLNNGLNLDFELKYLIDLNKYLSNEYRVPIPILTINGEKHVNEKYWLYEYI
ncbi:unnamed protein product, partial [Adineta steineri]